MDKMNKREERFASTAQMSLRIRSGVFRFGNKEVRVAARAELRCRTASQAAGWNPFAIPTPCLCDLKSDKKERRSKQQKEKRLSDLTYVGGEKSFAF
jgi:hypothetical protein